MHTTLAQFSPILAQFSYNFLCNFSNFSTRFSGETNLLANELREKTQQGGNCLSKTKTVTKLGKDLKSCMGNQNLKRLLGSKLGWQTRTRSKENLR